MSDIALKRSIDELENNEETQNKKQVFDQGDEEIEIEEEDDESIDDLKVEKKFGILQYTNPKIPGFFGIIKQRISDFHVNEIDQNESIVHLTNFDLPVIQKPTISLDNEQIEKLKSALGEEKFNELNEFCNKNDKSLKYQLIAPKEKSDRKLLHDYIKVNYPNYLSNTGQSNKDLLIEIFHKFYLGSNPQGAFKRKDKMEINYCQFVLYKDNIDTMQAVNMLAKYLRIQPKRISYCGTKDKRAKTCQLVTIFKLEPSEILKINDKSTQIKCGNFTFTNDALRLGDLNGNRFTIVLRQVESDDSVIIDSINSLKENGFINYYGLQRFGTTEVATNEIGKHLLKNNFKDAIDMILKPRKSLKEKQGVKLARESWEKNKNPKEAFEHIKYINCLEKFLLRGLCECDKNDYLGAFNYIPRNMRLLYIHAYQSYVWNLVASERIRLYGLKPIIGDLVFDKKSEEKTNNNVIKLDNSNINSYEIDDVLLPLPGFSIIYPENEIADYYKNILSTDGLDINKMKNPIKEFSLPGGYRYLMYRPTQIEYEILYYKDVKSDLILSDYEILNGVKLSGVSTNFDASDYPLKAVVLKFNLRGSSYATMVLREILKLDTSQSYQSSLNKS